MSDLEASSDASPSPRPFRRIVVVGCGLIGGSFALASMEVAGVDDVIVVDTDPEALRLAAELRVGTQQTDDLPSALVGADLVLLAVPVTALVLTAAAIRPHLGAATVVTDVGSVKGRLVEEVHDVAGLDGRYIGGHPMAGSERSGVTAAQGQLFQGATWLLTPITASHDAGFDRLAAHLRHIGARVLAVPPELHDELVALASHLPQALASVLMHTAADAAERTGQGLMAVAAGGFRDVTRVAASDPDLWVGILRENRRAFLRALDHFTDGLAALRSEIETEDWDGVHARLTTARAARRSLPRKEVPGLLVDLIVPIPDHPGALAEVTTALGTAGINIEDLSLRHATEGRRGAMVIAVDGVDAADRAIVLLADLGYHGHREVR